MRAITHLATALLALAVLPAANAGAAADGWAEKLLLAEIIVPQQPQSSNRSSGGGGAPSQAERARAYRNNEPAAGSTVIVVPAEEEEGLLSPRGGGAVENRSSEIRSRVRNYQQGGDSTGSGNIVVQPRQPAGTESTSERAQDNRSRARAYSQGETPAVVKSAQDGIPLVSCQDIDNVAGRIGDDMRSGAIVFIVKGNKQIKARCQ